MADLPLAGIRVVEVGSWVAGPAAAGILADWGADVIKVEPPDGDPFRQLFSRLAGLKEPTSPPFDLDNRGKRSVVLELATPEGQKAAAALLADADVFVTNARADALERAGLDHQTLLSRHPRLVYGSVTGYGLEGPQRDRAGYDLGAFWSRSGALWGSVPEGAEPPMMRGGSGDHVTAATIAGGIAAALLRRERTGRGGLVETSLLRCGAYTEGWDLSVQLAFGKVGATPPRTEPLNPLISTYRAGDGRWFFLLGLEADRHWPRIREALGDPDWAADERFANARGRRHHSAELVAHLDEVFATEALDVWAERFDAAEVWWDPVLTPEDVARDPQAEAAGVWAELPDGTRAVATPVSFDGERVRPRGGPPTLGEHTGEPLAPPTGDPMGRPL